MMGLRGLSNFRGFRGFGVEGFRSLSVSRGSGFML